MITTIISNTLGNGTKFVATNLEETVEPTKEELTKEEPTINNIN